MRLLRFFSGLAVRRQFCLLAAVALAVGGASVGASVKADVVAFDDFEGLTLLEFTVAGGDGDGTDWTNMIRTGTPREWTFDNSGMSGTTTELAYFGWTAMDIDSWIDEQGVQAGRDSFVGAGSNNTVLVVDPDAWDDFTTLADPGGFNSYAMRAYDLTGFDESTLEISLDYQFLSYANQLGAIEVSFDAGTTWQALATFDSTTVANSTFFHNGFLPDGAAEVPGPGVFNAGVDFTAGSEAMLLRIGCHNAGNDWWFVLDNILVTTGDGFSDLEDFEGLTLEKFTIAGDLGDGLLTDWTNDIPNWDIDNSGNLGQSLELAFDGWTAMDVGSWIAEQGGQGRSLLSLGTSPDNTALVADGDAFEDYDVDLDGNPWVEDDLDMDGEPDNPKPDEQVNTYISRTYDLSGFDNCTLVIDFLYEFRIENQQLGVAEVSFDGGTTWERILELDNNDGANGEQPAGAPIYTAGTEFQARQSNTMILRFGYLKAGNNWWFAIDEVQVQADPLTFVKGDANNNGVTDNLDLVPFTMAILDRPTYESTYGVNADIILDFNCDGTFNNLDIAGFVNVFLGN